MDCADLDIESFDIKKFICEVKKYPCIWNHTDDEYGNKPKKMDVWNKICRKFYNYESRDDVMKAKIELKLIKRWKTLRDSFVRALSNNQSRKYLYNKELAFLAKVPRKIRKRKHSAGKSTDDDDDDDKSLEPMVQIENIAFPFSSETSSIEQQQAAFSQGSNFSQSESFKQDHNDPFDTDKHFLMSLVGDMRRIPEEYKLDAKSEIIEVIKKYRTSPRNPIASDSVSTMVLKRDMGEY